MLSLFAWAIRYWATTITGKLDNVLTKVDKIAEDLHEHELEDAKYMARVSADVQNIYKRLDREGVSSG